MMNKIKILDYEFYNNLKQILNGLHIFGPDCTYQFDNYCYRSLKYVPMFKLKDINFNLQNKYDFKFKYIFNIITYKQIYNVIKKQNLDLAEQFKQKLLQLNSFKKEIKIFKLNFLIKTISQTKIFFKNNILLTNKSFNNQFNKYLKKFNKETVENCWQDINDLLYSKFFNYFFNFIIYKAQTQNNEKFGFNSLMSIKDGQKIQLQDLDEVYIYVHKDLGEAELNRQLSYIINKILEN